MIDTAADFGKIVMADLILSGDNALVIGMAASGLSPELRRNAIIFGIAIAAALRIVFALIATKLLGVPGILFVGSVLLFWVCWRLYQEIRQDVDKTAAASMAVADDLESGYTGAPKRTLISALVSIAVADVSMSLDNVLAVAAIAEGNEVLLVFGLGLAILLMACAATVIMTILTRLPWVSWLGLLVLLYVAAEMFYRGTVDADLGVGPLFGVMEGWTTGNDY